MSKMHHIFEHITEQQPDQCAVSYLTERVSYTVLNAQANRLARYLIQVGIQSGNYVPIIADKSIEAVIAVLAVWKVGAAYAPINPDLPKPMIESMISDISARWAMVQPGFQFSPKINIQSIPLDQLGEMSATFSEKNMTDIENNGMVESKNDKAYLIHTSGTTGKPKGVIVSHKNLISTFKSWQQEYELKPSDHHLQMAHFAFDVFTGDLVRALCSGGQLVLCPKDILLKPDHLYSFIVNEKITCGEFVPAVLKRLLNFVEREQFSLAMFRLLICGSDQWTIQELGKAIKICGSGTRVINSYGLTEGTIDSTYFEAKGDLSAFPDTMMVPIGKPFSHVKIYILDEHLQPVQGKNIGEIYIGGEGVALGYFCPDLTEKRFIWIETPIGRQRVYKTGDGAYFLEDGNVAFLGRHESQVKINGQRVELPAIETLLNEHPKVKQAIASATEIEGRRHINCFLVLSDVQVTRQELVNYLKQKLPCFSIPKHFYQIDEVSLTPSGKVDRRAISKQMSKEIKPFISMPRNELEIKIARIWAKILKLDIDQIGREQSFSDLGGSSLEYVSMLEAIHQEFSLQIALSMRAETIPALASQLGIYRQSRRHRIAIIGGGPAAVATLAQLLPELESKNLIKEVEIAVFEKSDNLGSGLPYSSPEDCYILNLPKEIMEPIMGKTGVFSQWLKDIPGCPQDTSFPPRHYFGQYLQFLANQLQGQNDSSGALIKYYTRCEVSDIRRVQTDTQTGYQIKTSLGDYDSQYVILCTGHMPTSTYCHLIGAAGYRHNPWEKAAFTEINLMDHVGIIGTGLTAIDLARKLISQGHQGQITMISRRGLLPAVLPHTVPPYTLKHLTLHNFNQLTGMGLSPLPLGTLLSLFWNEMSEAESKPLNWDTIFKSWEDISPLDWINREITEAEKRPRPWQQVLFAIYPILSNIWTYLSLKDQKIFLDKYYSTFLTYLAAFPLENAHKIKSYLQSGQLQVHGGLKDIKGQDWHFELIREGRPAFIPQHLFNATGQGYHIAQMPLYANMLKSRLIRQHPLGGIDVNPQTLRAVGSPSIYAIGEPTRGACLATADMGQVSLQARRVCIQVGQALNRKTRQKLPKYAANIYNSELFFKKPAMQPVGITPKRVAMGLVTAMRYFRK